MECNIFIPAKLFVLDNNNDIKPCGEAMIKANRHLFKSVTVISKYIEIFDFVKNYLIVQIQIVKNCKTKISIKTMAYAQLVINFFKNGF